EGAQGGDELGRARVLEHERRMVLEVLAHSGQLVRHGDVDGAQVVGRADARPQQHRRGAVGAGRQDDLAAGDAPRAPVVDELDGDGPAALDDDAVDQNPADHLYVAPATDGVEVGEGAVPADAVGDVDRRDGHPEWAVEV